MLDPGALGPPHCHEHEEELSTVLEGEIGVRVGDDEVPLAQGGVAFKSRGVPHASWNPGSIPARLFDVICPAGVERFFDKMATLPAGPTDLPPGQIERAGAAFGLSFRPDWVAGLGDRHGLTPIAQ